MYLHPSSRLLQQTAMPDSFFSESRLARTAAAGFGRSAFLEALPKCQRFVDGAPG